MYSFVFFPLYGDHPDLLVLTHSYPTRPSSDLASSNRPTETRRFREKPLRYSFSSCHFPLFLNVTPLRSTPISFYLTETPRPRCARRVGDKWPPEPPC